ncbi:MAG: glycosyltransferase family 4 protein [Opitutales bacterium]
MRIGILSIAPSPYQRDLFACMAQVKGVALSVFYWEKWTPDSPWKIDALHAHESVLDSSVYNVAKKRIHLSKGLPNPVDFDFLIFNGYLNLSYFSYVRRIPERVRTVWFGEPFFIPSNRFIASLYRWLRGPITNVDGVIAIGKRAYEQYMELFPGRPRLNQPYAIDIKSYARSKREACGDKINILFCGQLIHRKGFDLLLDAFRALINDNEIEALLELTVVGDGDLRGLIDQVESSVRERIHYLGFIQPAELPAVFGEADLFVLPSRYDGWGVVINQAIAAELPIVTTEAVGAADLIDERNGRVVAPNDSGAIVDAVKDLVLHRNEWPSIGSHNCELSKNISPESGARNIVEFLRGLEAGS